MPHPKDDELLPIGTQATWKKNGLTVVIRGYNFQYEGRGFLNYFGVVQGRDGLFALYHDDLEPAASPPPQKTRSFLM